MKFLKKQKKVLEAKTFGNFTILFEGKADSTRYGGNFRKLIVDIKHTFKELGIQDFFISEYNNFRINPEIKKCDYYDFLNGDQAAIKSFMGEFLS